MVGHLREEADKHVLVLLRVGVELPRCVVRKFDSPRVWDGPKFVISLVPFLDSLDSIVEIDAFENPVRFLMWKSAQVMHN